MSLDIKGIDYEKSALASKEETLWTKVSELIEKVFIRALSLLKKPKKKKQTYSTKGSPLD